MSPPSSRRTPRHDESSSSESTAAIVPQEKSPVEDRGHVMSTGWLLLSPQVHALEEVGEAGGFSLVRYTNEMSDVYGW